MGGDTNIQQPSQPSYGEGLSEALQAQVGLLTGTGDFADTGSLESLLPLEESIRRKTAQADTDILRRTLLGGEEGGQTQEVTYDDQGRAISGYTEPGEAKIRTVIEDSDGNVIPNAGDPNVVSDAQRVRVEFVDANGNVIDQSDDLPITSETLDKFSDGRLVDGPLQIRLSSTLTNLTDQLISNLENNPDFDQETLDRIKTERSSIPGFDQKTMMGSEGFDGYGLNKNQNSYAITDAQPIFAKDTEGNVITDVSKAGTTETTTLPTFRSGDGMVDILGDSRGVQETVARPDYEQYVRNNPEYMAEVARDNAKREQQGLPTRSLAEWGEAHYAREGEAKGDTLPTSYEQSDTGRQAGFASAEEGGGFLGLSAFTEDLAAGNLSRQRERDLLDVARLSGTYQDIMEDYKPGTQEALADAKEVLASQKDNLTGAGAIDIPKDSTFASMGNVKVADPNKLSASTAFNRQLGLEDGTLRSDILSDAQTALGQGLTSREQDAISEAFKARSTMMGRTFDQSAGIAEAEARVAEDNARRMQNRAFAQSVLGQEAGLQQGDITRGMGQEAQQAQLQQQVNMTQADVDMRAALANQAQQQQAGQFQQATTADAQRLNEQLKQSGTLGYIDAATRLAALEDQSTLDPFQAVLGRGGGQSLQAGQSVFGQAGYGLNSGPQYLNPEAGLGFIQNQAANAASMYNAQVGAEAAKTAGLYSGLGSLGGGLLGNLNVGPFGG